MLYVNFREFVHKGSSVLVMSLVSVGAMASIAFGISKMHELNYSGIRASHAKIQADQYAQDRAAILRSMDFGSVAVMSKRVVGGTASSGENENTYYEEVVEEPSESEVYKEFKVNIYKGKDNNDVVSSLVIRKTNPGYLIDGQLVGSNEASDKKALNSEASQDYAKSRFNDSLDSVSSTNAMSAKSLKLYVESVLADYVKSDNAVKREKGKGAGTVKDPVYVALDGYVKQGKVTTRMDLNSSSSKIAVLTKENDVYYIDYLKKSDFFSY